MDNELKPKSTELTASQHINKGHRKGFCLKCKEQRWLKQLRLDNGMRAWECTECAWYLLKSWQSGASRKD